MVSPKSLVSISSTVAPVYCLFPKALLSFSEAFTILFALFAAALDPTTTMTDSASADVANCREFVNCFPAIFFIFFEVL